MHFGLSSTYTSWREGQINVLTYEQIKPFSASTVIYKPIFTFLLSLNGVVGLFQQVSCFYSPLLVNFMYPVLFFFLLQEVLYLCTQVVRMLVYNDSTLKQKLHEPHKVRSLEKAS